jgi:hypothetical protein
MDGSRSQSQYALIGAVAIWNNSDRRDQRVAYNHRVFQRERGG